MDWLKNVLIKKHLTEVGEAGNLFYFKINKVHIFATANGKFRFKADKYSSTSLTGNFVSGKVYIDEYEPFSFAYNPFIHDCNIEVITKLRCYVSAAMDVNFEFDYDLIKSPARIFNRQMAILFAEHPFDLLKITYGNDVDDR